MKMIKRTLCLILSLIMVIGMFPVNAFATGDELLTLPVADDAAFIPEQVIVPDVATEVTSSASDLQTAWDNAVTPDSAANTPVADIPASESAMAVPEMPAVTTEPAAVPVASPVAVLFSCTPAELTLTVWDAYGVAVAPQADGSWLLLPGNYSYSAYCDGYLSLDAVPFTVTEGFGSMYMEVVLTAVTPVQDVNVHSCVGELEAVSHTDGSAGWYCAVCGGIFDENMQQAGMSFAVPATFSNSAAISGSFNGFAAEVDASGNLLINEVNFPDAAFRQYIINSCAKTSTSYLTAAEAASLMVIDCSNAGITSLKGVEFFSGLRRIDCSGNSLSSLDVSGHTSLTVLNCASNQLTSLNVSGCTALTELDCSGNSLSSLDVSSCTALDTLSCDGNSIPALNLAGNSQLSWVSSDQSVVATAVWSTGGLAVDIAALVGSANLANILSVRGGSFDAQSGLVTIGFPADGVTTVNFTYNYSNQAPNVPEQSMSISPVSVSCAVPEGKPLYISANNFPDAAFRQYISENMDTAGAGYLTDDMIASVKDIYCAGKNIYSLEGLEYFTALSSLDCSNNHISALNLSDNTALTTLGTNGQTISATACWVNGGCYVDLGAIAGSENLEQIGSVSGGSFDSATGLVSLTVPDGADSLEISYSYDTGANLAGGVMSVSVSVTVPNRDLIYIDSANFPDAAFRQYVSDTFDQDGLGYTTAEQLAQITGLYISNKGIASLKGLEYFTGITTLYCDNNNLTALDLSRNTALVTVRCHKNSLGTLTLGSNANLKSLTCYNNALSALDLSGNPNLTNLNCSANKLSTLNLSANTALTDLDCSGNKLSALDLSGNLSLTYLNCSENALGKLDLAANTKLNSLDGVQSVSDSAYWDGDALKYDLSKLVGTSGLALVSSVTGGSYDAATGIVSLTAPGDGSSITVSYSYDTKAVTSISTVTVTLTLAVPGIDESSKCGDKLTWSFDAATGILTISGTGDMYSYKGVTTPWAGLPYTAAVIESGVTGIGEDAFPTLTGTLTIKSGASVSVNGRISLESGSKLIVEEGASLDLSAISLILNGGTIDLKGSITSLNGQGFISIYPALYSGGIGSAVIGTLSDSVKIWYSYNVSDAASLYAALEKEHDYASITASSDITVDKDITVPENNNLIVSNCVLSIPAKYTLTLNGILQTIGSSAKVQTVREIVVGELGDLSNAAVTYVDCEHDWSEDEVITEATCVEEGLMRYVCSLCSETKTGSIELVEHTIGQMDANYTDCCGGYKAVYYRCSVCGQDFADDTCENEAVFTAASNPSTLIHHDATYADCSGGYEDDYYECPVCGVLYTDAERSGIAVYSNAVAQHSLVSESANYSVCSGGYKNDYFSCIYCGMNFADETAAAEPVYTEGTGMHNMEFNEAYYNACEGGFLEDYYYCTLCRGLFVDEEGSEYAQFTEGNGAHQLRLTHANYVDCIGGYTSDFYHCSICLGDFVDDQASERAEYVEGNGRHNLMQMTADYTECGGGFQSAYFICTVCGAAYVDEQCSNFATYIDGNGQHSPVYRKLPAIPATSTDTGLKSFYTNVCDVCGMFVKADGSDYSYEELEVMLAPYIVYAKATSVTISDSEGTILNSTTQNVELSTTAEMQLYADILPITAMDGVRWKSSNTTIATVNAEGLVSFIKPGAVTITATAADGSNKSATVKFDIQFKGISASARFTAKLADESSTFAQPTKIGLQLDDSAQFIIYGADKKTPIDPALYADLFDFSVKHVASGDYVEVDGNGIITAIKTGTASVIATFRDDPLKRSVTLSVKTIAQQIGTIDILPANMADTRFVGIDENGDLCSVSELDAASYAIMVDAIPKGTPLTAENSSFVVKPVGYGTSGAEQPLAKGQYTWASTGAGIASVRENNDGTATITIKSGVDGACTITATSKDSRKAQGSIAVYVMDKSPRLEAASAVLDTQAGNSVRLALIPSYGNELRRDVQCVEYYDSAYNSKTKDYEGKSGLINVLYDFDTEELIIEGTQYIKNSTIKGQLKVKTIDGKTYPLPLNITIKNTLPTVTVKQLTKFNVFLADSSATFQVSAKGFAAEDIEGITFESNTANKATASFTGSSRNSDTLDIFYNDFGGKLNTKGTIYVQLKGYSFPIEKAVTVGTVTTKPSLVLDPANLVINSAVIKDENQLTLQVKDRSGKTIIDLSDDEVSFTGAVPAGLSVGASGDHLILRGDKASLEAYKGGRLTVNIKDSNWTGPVAVSFNVSKNSSAASAKLAKTTLTINSAYAGISDETAVLLSHSNMSTAALTVKSIQPTKSNDETAKLNVVYENGLVRASIKDGEIVKAGSYSYSLIPEYEGSELKAITFTVKVVNTPPTAKLSKATLTLNNVLTAQTDAALLTATDNTQTVGSFSYKSKAAAGSTAAEQAEMIGLTMDEAGYITAFIKDGMSPKAGTYSYEVNAVLSSGELKAAMKPMTLSVKVINTQPKLSLSASTINLNTTAALAGIEEAFLTVKSNTAGYTVTGTRVEIADTNATLLPEYSKIKLASSGDTVSAKLYGNELPKLTNYKYRVYPTVQYAVGESSFTAELSPINFTVKVFNNSNYSAAVSAKGSLVSMNCDVSAITYTVTRLNNVSGKVVDVAISGQDKDLFAVSFGGYDAKGQPFAVLTPKEGDYVTNKTYKVQLDFTLESGIKVSTSALNVRVTNTTLKLASTPKLINVYQSQSRSRIISYTISATAPVGAAIGEVKLGNVGLLQSSLVNENTNVYFVYNSDGSVTVKVILKDTSKLAANKTYTLPLLIRAEGQASNTADTKLNLSLKVLK